jgi:hypothetical protein
MKYLYLGLGPATGRRIYTLLLIGIASMLYSPLIYAVTIYYAYFMAWDITSTNDVKLKTLKSFMAIYGFLLGTSLIFLFKPEVVTAMLSLNMFMLYWVKLFITYEASVILFLYIHHFGLNPKKISPKP